MFSMPSQNTRRKVRLNEKVESRVRGDLYARFGGEYLETYHCKKVARRWVLSLWADSIC